MRRTDYTKPEPTQVESDYDHAQRWSHLNKRPKKIVYKIPMSRRVIDNMGDTYQYDFTEEGIVWTFLGSTRFFEFRNAILNLQLLRKLTGVML